MSVKRRRSYWILCIIGLSFLCFSVMAEEFWNIPMSPLCQFHRLMFLLLAILSGWGVAFEDKVFLMKSVQLILCAGCVFSVYHMAVQYRFVPDPCIVLSSHEACGDGLFRTYVPCSAVTVSLFGLPYTVYVALMTFGGVLLVEKEMAEVKKERKGC